MRRSEGEDLERVLQEVVSDFDRLLPHDAEMRHLRRSDAYTKPTKRWLGRAPGVTNPAEEDYYAYDSDLISTLEALFKHRPKVWSDVKRSCRKWKQPQGWRTSTAFDPAWVIEDTCDGAEFERCSPQPPG